MVTVKQREKITRFPYWGQRKEYKLPRNAIILRASILTAVKDSSIAKCFSLSFVFKYMRYIISTEVPGSCEHVSANITKPTESKTGPKICEFFAKYLVVLLLSSTARKFRGMHKRKITRTRTNIKSIWTLTLKFSRDLLL